MVYKLWNEWYVFGFRSSSVGIQVQVFGFVQLQVELRPAMILSKLTIPTMI